MFKKILLLITAISVGAFFSYLNFPAGWLVGAIVTGMVCTFFIGKVPLSNDLFKIVLAMIGANIGLMLSLEQFMDYHLLLVPFIGTLLLTLIGGLSLGRFLKRFTNLDHNTAFFCCLPGGASEVIALSHQYGADQQIVAAFHTARITLFVLVIPFVVGSFVPATSVVVQQGSFSFQESAFSLILLIIVMIITLILARRFPIPGAPLFFAIALGFLVQTFFPNVTLPSSVTGIAQGIMGAIIGIRFDRDSLLQLKRIGIISGTTLALYFLMSLLLATIFFLLTPMNWFTSLLSIVPAGAAEMTSTATALDIQPDTVAILQMGRVLVLMSLLPLLIKLFARVPEKGSS